ncbi:MAG: M20/M25/M40 family metallo-hydrolase [Magnetococcales bacterium]|nr:M20/M25/M40 family metallo-hydrolase [Magnetococcales bacterium]
MELPGCATGLPACTPAPPMIELSHWFAPLSGVGWSQQGRNALAYTPQEDQAQALFARQLQSLGLRPRQDGWGNHYGLYHPPGVDPNTPAIAIGSHLDSTPAGGRFDGVLGVAAGLAVLARLQQSLEQDGPPLCRPLCLIAWRGEESSRFGISCIGSKGAAGLLTLEQCRAYADRLHPQHPMTLYEAVAPRRGPDPSPVAPGRVDTLLELHIEQGPTLAEAKRQHPSEPPPVGVVTQAIAGAIRERLTLPPNLPALHLARMLLSAHSVAGGLDCDRQRPFRLTVTPANRPPNVGRSRTRLQCRDQAQAQQLVAVARQRLKPHQPPHPSSITRRERQVIFSGPHSYHSGTQPMAHKERLDQILSAARALEALEQALPGAAQGIAWPDFSRHTEATILQLDWRAAHETQLTAGSAQVRREIEHYLHRHDIPADWSIISRTKPAAVTPEVAQRLLDAARQEGVPTLAMASGAGHDVQIPPHMQRGLLFVVSEANGVSHHHSEWTDMADAEVGVQVLTRTVLGMMRG